ncbi:MAG: asparagine synthase (glutamine-hydrolyzing) [Fibrobacteria bacterium]|nr:asparagine synthase (glutamine-hydrolyzing) [Fibrobacteria bacterium]
MCGILGSVGNYARPLFETALNNLSHRGPDGEGIWEDTEYPVILGHRRLAILDLSSAGRQPMIKGDLVAVFNGEIYNYIELKRDLEHLGHHFRTSTDTEVLLAAYQEWGEQMLQKLNGMWGLAIYNVRDKSLFLSRDRFGVKPVYYSTHRNNFSFASEVQALHVLLGYAHPLNGTVISQITSGFLAHHGTEQTYLQNVYSLPAGCNLTLKDGNKVIKQWYTLRTVPVSGTLKTQAEELLELLENACKIRLRSDVPVATCLSGGLDSGSITALLNTRKLENTNSSRTYTHKSFCAAFFGSPIDESAAATGLAKKLNNKLEIVSITAPSPDSLEQVMCLMDGPMPNLAFYPISQLYREIKNQGISVTLDGQGPDEMLGGYFVLKEALNTAMELKDFPWFFDVYRTYMACGETSQYSMKKEAKKVLQSVLQAKVKTWWKYFLWHFKSHTSALPYNVQGGDSGISENFIPKRPILGNTLDRLLYSQFFESILPGLFQQYDRCSMAYGVECRMPFVDYRLVEYLFSLPPRSKIGGGYTKRVLREAVKDILPDSIRLNKQKIGFNSPIVDWFSGPLKTYMSDQMASSAFLESGFFDGRSLRSDFETFLKSPAPQWNTAWKFWGPVHFTWWQAFVGRKS